MPSNLHESGENSTDPYIGHKAVMLLRDREAWVHVGFLAFIALGTILLLCWPVKMTSLPFHCSFRAVFHINCPFCGMTRDFAAILHGQQPKLNPFSWAAAVIVYVAYPAVFLWAWLKQRLNVFHKPVVHKLFFAGLVVMLIANNFKLR
jgi:hypothetical protein